MSWLGSNMRLTLQYDRTPESAKVVSEDGVLIENVLGFQLVRNAPLGENELRLRISIPRASQEFCESQVSSIGEERR